MPPRPSARPHRPTRAARAPARRRRYGRTRGTHSPRPPRRRSASDSRGISPAGGSFVRLLEGHAARVDAHPDAFVERYRAGGVLGVDVERDPRRAAAPELAERPVEQRLGEPLASPRRPDSDRAHVAPAGDVRVVARDGGELVPVTDDEPDGAVLVAVLAAPALDPL